MAPIGGPISAGSAEGGVIRSQVAAGPVALIGGVTVLGICDRARTTRHTRGVYGIHLCYSGCSCLWVWLVGVGVVGWGVGSGLVVDARVAGCGQVGVPGVFSRVGSGA